jgi:hypothetical protein
MSIHLDDSLWPLLVARLKGPILDPEFEVYLEGLEACLRRGPFFAILDVSHYGTPATSQRQRQVEWLREHQELIRERFLAIAFVVTSPFVRVALSLVLHMRPLACPYVTVSDLGAAHVWMANHLERAGLGELAASVRHPNPLHPG